MSQKSYEAKNALYLIPTPIGNMGDITLRSIDTLKMCDIIFSEDTRETLKLLTHLDIHKKIISCHKFNEDKEKEKILKYLQDNKNVALVSDRGTPAISDPGYTSAYYAIKNGYNVISLPGATAFVPALTMSGLNPNKFLFYGFLNSKKSSKKKEIEDLKNIKYTIIFYESPFRVVETLEIIKEILGDRKVSISREISKKHEEIFRGTISEVLKELDNPKGEFVIVLEECNLDDEIQNIDIIKEIEQEIKNGKSEKDSIKEISKKFNLSKNEVYLNFIKHKKNRKDEDK